VTGARSSWLVPLFLLFGVLAPTGCVLWFMNTAARIQGAAARQSVTDAYRGQLRLLRDRVDSYWLDRAAALDAAAAGSEAVAFQRIVQQGLADSVVLSHYPSPAREAASDPTAGRPDWQVASELERAPGKLAEAAEQFGRIAQSDGNFEIAARAAQAQIRCLVRRGDKEGALLAIQRYFVAGRLRGRGRLENRSIAADELLLTLRLLKSVDPRYGPAAEHLAEMLNDYAGAAMPSAQRLFLMDELYAALPNAAALPTREAERLALVFLDKDTATPGERSMERTHVPDVWKLASPSGRVIALYRTSTVQAAMRMLFAERDPSRGVKFDVVPPGAQGGPEAIAAGASLPGWQLNFSLVDSKLLDDAERARTASYLWIGYLVIASLAVTGGLVGQWLRREARLARLKTDLVAAVSHELRTPLASMRLLVETLLDDAVPEPAKVHDYLTLIARENQRLSRLIENFLTFSRIERNRQQFVFAPTPVSGVIDKAVTAMGERLRPPSCELELELSDRVAPVSADEDALVTVMVNLLDNACKYTPGARRICVSASGTGESVILSVKDNGIGIAAREHRRIFRRFYQVDQRLARETGGCGLGLSIVEFVVRAHGGRVRVESRPGAGSTFSVILPRAGSSSATEREAL
jgi:signal transduction histidine kinase